MSKTRCASADYRHTIVWNDKGRDEYDLVFSVKYETHGRYLNIYDWELTLIDERKPTEDESRAWNDWFSNCVLEKRKGTRDVTRVCREHQREAKAIETGRHARARVASYHGTIYD